MYLVTSHRHLTFITQWVPNTSHLWWENGKSVSRGVAGVLRMMAGSPQQMMSFTKRHSVTGKVTIFLPHLQQEPQHRDRESEAEGMWGELRRTLRKTPSWATYYVGKAK